MSGRIVSRHPHLRQVLPFLLASLVVAMGIAGLTACARQGASPSPAATPEDPVVVRVNGVDVTQSQIDVVRAEARLGGRRDGMSQARREATGRALVRQEAKRLGVHVTEAAVQQGVSDLEQSAGGAQALDAALSEAQMTRGQLTQAVGYSWLARALADAKYPDVAASASEARGFYDRHRDLYTTGASYHLAKITVPGEKLAWRLARRLRRGASFTETARRYSMDTQTRYRGGDVGWVLTVTVPRDVLAVVRNAGPRGIADPVWSSGKWQVFKVLGERPARVISFSRAREAIVKELTRRRRASALKRWVEREMQRAGVVSAG